MSITLENRQQGRLLFAQGMQVAEIARELDINRSTVESWKKRDGWRIADIYDDVALGLRARLLALISMTRKGNSEYKEIDALMRQLERSARIDRYRDGGNETDLNPKIANRNAKPKAKKLTNQISAEQLELLEEAFRKILFIFQIEWVDTIESSRIFILLKSRQIGATYIVALWSIIHLLKTGNNKIFMSASKAQAYQFIEYIKSFVLEVLGLELTGDPIIVNGPNGQGTIYYLGTNSKTAQGRHGDIIMDEFMWIRKFLEFRKVASGMASQKMYRQIYLSTASSILHESFNFWAGKDGKRKLPIDIDISHAALKRPVRCPDRRTRQIVTLDDAIDGGFDRFDREELLSEYSDDDAANLYFCQFVDDSGSFFPLGVVEPNMVDSWEVWDDFKPFGSRPFSGPVWIGYDPSFTGDNAALAVIAPPQTPMQPYRILERFQYKMMPPHVQAQHIEKICQRYQVDYLAIDNTGNGISVAEHVQLFYPRLVRLNYNVAIKTRMALRAKELFARRRLHFDAGLTDLAKSFMSIKKALTGSQSQMTFVASRSLETGHADVAWAVMHALEKAPIADSTDPSTQSRRSGVRIIK